MRGFRRTSRGNAHRPPRVHTARTDVNKRNERKKQVNTVIAGGRHGRGSTVTGAVYTAIVGADTACIPGGGGGGGGPGPSEQTAFVDSNNDNRNAGPGNVTATVSFVRSPDDPMAGGCGASGGV